ncbi:hypothetical protein AB4Y85_03040 [Microvirga sp. 2YAF29]|uniref:hypothetical protein n=1 Tax=Microvirga sp. 2YAF29 TaxID=3233031 RepID=UPI003F973482
MRRLLWVIAWIAVAIWSLVAWGTYGLFDLFGGMAVRNADMIGATPESVEWIAWALAALRGLGLGAIVFVWGLVSLLTLAVPAVLGLLVPRSQLASMSGERRDYPAGPRGDGYQPPPQAPLRQIERR